MSAQIKAAIEVLEQAGYNLRDFKSTQEVLAAAKLVTAARR